MSNSRRQFLANSCALVGASAVAGPQAAAPASAPQAPPPAGSPPAFGTAPPVGPEVSAATFAAAERLVQVELTAAQRTQAARNWRNSMAALYERRLGPRKVALGTELTPYSTCTPLGPAPSRSARPERFVRSARAAGALPSTDAAIALAPLWKLSRWIEARQLSSERLTHIYLQRIEALDPKLRCIVTLTREPALAAALRADREIAAGKYRGPLHGVPWGGKDLLDTAGIPTTYGAEPYRNRVPAEDAAVVKRLHQAGAILVAKLSLGALALNDIWFGGQTMNPWLLEEGASGSSAGPGAATAAGL